jgi:hypothetical protein
MQIKMTLRFHLTPPRMLVIKQTNVGEDVCVGKGLSYTLLVGL